MRNAYRNSARYYDLLYAWKNYRKEATIIRKLVRQNKASAGIELLEVACGTGNHIRYLKDYFSVTGTDINPYMLAIARKKFPKIPFRRSDMVTLSMGKQFDVILCLFSSIGYVKTLRNLDRTIHNFARHLKPGGVILIEPWLTKSEYKVGGPHSDLFGDENTKIARLSISKIRGTLSILDLHHLVALRNIGVKYFVEHHELSMFETQDFLRLMKKSGLHASFRKSGFGYDRGIYVGVKGRTLS